MYSQTATRLPFCLLFQGDKIYLFYLAIPFIRKEILLTRALTLKVPLVFYICQTGAPIFKTA